MDELETQVAVIVAKDEITALKDEIAEAEDKKLCLVMRDVEQLIQHFLALVEIKEGKYHSFYIKNKYLYLDNKGAVYHRGKGGFLHDLAFWGVTILLMTFMFCLMIPWEIPFELLPLKVVLPLMMGMGYLLCFFWAEDNKRSLIPNAISYRPYRVFVPDFSQANSLASVLASEVEGKLDTLKKEKISLQKKLEEIQGSDFTDRLKSINQKAEGLDLLRGKATDIAD